jgi:hypothetical protein
MLIHQQNLYVSHSKQHTGHHETQSHGPGSHTQNIPGIDYICRLVSKHNYTAPNELTNYGISYRSILPHMKQCNKRVLKK